ncbi:7-cyano-7-deazaguanine synthase [Sporomusa sphaeroides]
MLRNDAIDGWSRNIELYIPVLELDKWKENCDLLEKMVSFLSGDYWKFNFRKRELTAREIAYKERIKKSKQAVKDYDRVCMFSGGLDSFVGAIDILEDNVGHTLFVSHYGGGKGTKEYQDLLKEKFIDGYGVEIRDFHQYYAKVVGGIEDTTRTRSFLFFTHAIAVASTLGKSVDLIIPENGLISLNIPLTFSRFGTSSTRTTHPFYLKLLQTLLYNINIPVRLKNPYQFYTKGEMLNNCKNQEFLKHNLANTMSCSHPDIGRRLKETKTRHCGYCLPCVIRQAAIKRAEFKDESYYYDNKFVQGKTAKTNLNSYRLGFERFNPKFAFMSIQKSGSIIENIDQFTQLYIRGMNEVKAYLEGL